LARTAAPERGGDTLRLGLIAAPDTADQLARQLAGELPAVLRERVSSEVAWAVPVVTDTLGADSATAGSEIIDRARERMLREGWNLAVYITDVPLRIGRRPVVADASAMHGVGVICLPALGARHLQRRATDAIVRLVDGLVGERMDEGARERHGGSPDQTQRRRRVAARLAALAASVHRVVPDDDDVDLRFVSAVLRGHVRLLLGMVRTNQPWRMATGLSKALAAALGAVAFALVSSELWPIADSLGWLRLLVLTVAAIAVTVVSLIVAHDLWERAGRRAREQTLLFNVATALTITLGVLWLYAVLFVVTLAGAALVLTGGVLERSLGHEPRLGDYAGLAWMISSLAILGGALAAGLEDDHAVRQAAYGYHAERKTGIEALDG
jgi:hypothetical protein